MVLFGQGGSNPAMWFLFGRKWLYSDKVVAVGQIGCIRQGGCIRANKLFSGKVVAFGKKWLYFAKSGCTRAKVVVFGQCECFLAKVVVLGQNWLYSDKVVVLGKSGFIRAR